MSDKQKNASKKSKYWGALSWHDSEPEDIFDRAKKCNIEACCILHDQDKNELATPVLYTDEELQPGQAKKAHRHWIFAFPNTTTENHAKAIIQEITNGNPPIALSNIKGAFAYLTHKHDPDKHQYDSEAIMYFNGFVPENYINLGAGEEDQAFQAIEAIVDRFGIEEYSELIKHLQDNNPDLARFARNHTLHLNAYVRSKHQAKRQAKKDRLLDLQLEEYELRILERKQKLGIYEVDESTGEVVEWVPPAVTFSPAVTHRAEVVKGDRVGVEIFEESFRRNESSKIRPEPLTL